MAPLMKAMISSLFSTYLFGTVFGDDTSCTTRCGTNWVSANAQCEPCCTSPADCGDTTHSCWADLSLVPCNLVPSAPTTQSPTLTPTTALPTRATPAPIPTTAVPTRAPLVGNTIGDYRIATISGCGSGKYASLTFDDGPMEQHQATQTVISKLNAHGIKATFYVSPAANPGEGNFMSQRCDLIQELTDAGNEVQSHSWSHPDFRGEIGGGPLNYAGLLTEAEIKWELDRVSDWIVGCGGAAPTIFRPPYGSLNKQQAEYIVGELRYIIGLWNMDSNDWRTPNDWSGISQYIDLNLYGGDSVNILMHDKSSYAIVDDVINLFNDGYQFITQSECFRRCDTIDADGVCNDRHGRGLYILDTWRESPSTPITPAPSTPAPVVSPITPAPITPAPIPTDAGIGNVITVTNRPGSSAWWYTVTISGIPAGDIEFVQMKHSGTTLWQDGEYQQWGDYYAFNKYTPMVPPLSFQIGATNGRIITKEDAISSFGAGQSAEIGTFASSYTMGGETGESNDIHLSWTVWFAIFVVIILCLVGAAVGLFMYKTRTKGKGYVGDETDGGHDTIELREDDGNDTVQKTEMIDVRDEDEEEAEIEVEIEAQTAVNCQ